MPLDFVVTKGAKMRVRTMMRLAVLFVLLALPAQAQTATYRDWMGREVGSATTRGNTTTYYDRMGREAGRATRSGGSTTVYNSIGRQVGHATRR